MEESSKDKTQRTLQIFAKLSDGYVLNKTEEAVIYGVNERTIQRDIDDIRNFLDVDSERTGISNSVEYDRDKKGYRLEALYKVRLKNSEILAICKILLDSRAFTKAEMDNILEKLIICCVPQSNQKLVKDLIGNEAFHYVELHHKSEFIEKMWAIGQALRDKRYIDITYSRLKDKELVRRRIKPVSIMFSEYYFYLTAFIDDEEVKKDFDVLNDSFPTIYRIDRIQSLQVAKETFHIPYSSRFEEGEFRKRIQFMYGGKLQRIRFSYSGPDVYAILDKFPTARIIEDTGDTQIIEAETFGKGVTMFLLAQGSRVKALAPESFVKDMKTEVEKIYNMYK
ncbi:MAG: WYL domain-containing protein [bacterium]|nr:WYL domain-containing protein [bacterium]